jgi:uncharacterized protein YqgC (DUF456 family)
LSLLVDSVGFGLAVAFILLGIIGVIVPLLPGLLLVWLTTLAYAWATDFGALTPVHFALITVIALVTGSAGIWMPMLGAKKTGARGLALVLGIVGGLIGTLFLPLLGTIIGYALGIVIGEYIMSRDLRLALKASVGGVAGWGIATLVELGGAILILIIFLLTVLSA